MRYLGVLWSRARAWPRLALSKQSLGKGGIIMSASWWKAYNEKYDQDKDTILKIPWDESSSYDKALTVTSEEYDRVYGENRMTETSWWDRLRIMWVGKYADGTITPELEVVLKSTSLSFFTGFAWGGIREGSEARKAFVVKHNAEMFTHPYLATRKLNDTVILASSKGGMKLGWRMGLLAFLFSSVSASLLTIRGYVNPLDYTIGGFVMGTAFKALQGPRAMLSGGLISGFMGFTIGSSFALLSYLAGFDYPEYIRQRHLYKLTKLELEGEKKDTADSDFLRAFTNKEFNMTYEKPSERSTDDVKVNLNQGEEDMTVGQTFGNRIGQAIRQFTEK